MLRSTLSEWMTQARDPSVSDRGAGSLASRHDEQGELAPPTPVTLLADEASATASSSIARARNLPSTKSTHELDAPIHTTTTTTTTTPPRSSRSAPEKPRFIGPTTSAFSLQAGDRALSRLGIPAMNDAVPSGQHSPEDSSSRQSAEPDESFFDKCDPAEFSRLMTVFKEEIESVYPCLDTDELTQNSAELLEFGRMSEAAQQANNNRLGRVTIKDLHLSKIALATAMVIETHGKSQTSTMLIGPVERSILNILRPSRELRDLQLLILLVSMRWPSCHKLEC
jgi:hypothetical protein